MIKKEETKTLNDTKASAIKTEELPKDAVAQKKGRFLCKKCNQLKLNRELRWIPVTQRNRPMEAEHITFSSKAQIAICESCHKAIMRG